MRASYRSDLFRFGGATSLRGYDEDRFLGRVVGRALIEYRFLMDRESFAYAFVDVGFVDRPETPDLTSSESGLHPGYGLGIQFRTAVGLVNVSAALNPESGPTDARIHAGLSFGL
jgi:outer membrane translocation and assembly module TamA